MKPDMENIDEVVNRYLPSASKEDVESGGARVLHRLESGQPAASSNSRDQRWFFGWRRVAMMVTAAAAVILAVFVGLIWQERAFAIVESVDGSLYRVVAGKNQAIAAGQAVNAGENIRSNGGAGGTLKLADGSRVEMRSKSELVLERADDGIRVRLRNGSVIVNAAKHRTGHLYVQTKDLTASVIGTVFLVNAEEEGSRVAVIEGEVRVKQGETEKSLRPGEQTSTSPTLQPLPVKEEITWSRNAEAHVALLQQAESRLVFEEASIRPAGPFPVPGGGGRGGPDPSNPCVVSGLQIDPGRFAATRVSLYWLIRIAYGKGNCTAEEMFAAGAGLASGLDPVSGEPGWVKSDQFAIHVLFPKGTFSEKPQLTDAKLQLMLQALLSARSSLAVRRDAKELQGYVLTLGKGGPKLMPSKERETVTWSTGYRFGKDQKGETVARLSGANASIADLVYGLQEVTGRRVVDRTGVMGNFNYRVEYAPFDGGVATALGMIVADSSYPSLFTALQEQLGLKLEPGKIPIEVLVIERVERPSEN